MSPARSPCLKFYPRSSHKGKSLMSSTDNSHSQIKHLLQWGGRITGWPHSCPWTPRPALSPYPSSLIRIFCVLTSLLPRGPAFPSSVSSSVNIYIHSMNYHSHSSPTVILLPLSPDMGTDPLCSLFLCLVLNSTGVHRLPGSGLHMFLLLDPHS